MQHRFLFLLTFLYWTLPVQAQKIKEFVKENIIPVRSIEPDSTNYDDLVSIGNDIGDNRIVMLGEQDHGDAPTFLAKTRLIKYLHEQKGFTVLAFESDFFSLNEGWDKLDKTQKAIDTFLRQNIFAVWALCKTCSNLLYDYIPYTFTTAKPLQVTGFDNQLMLNYSAKHLVSSLDSLCKLLQLPVTKEANYSSKILPLIDSLRYWDDGNSASVHPFDTCYQYLDEIRTQLSHYFQKDNFWMMVVENLMQENKFLQTLTSNYQTTSSIRDYQMAMNLNWLVKHKFPNDKIIVWAANGHIGKVAYNSNDTNTKPFETMGSYFTKDSLNSKNTYIMGFASYEGEAGRIGAYTYNIEKPKTNGFENWVDNNVQYAFIDFNKLQNKSEPFFMKGFLHKNVRQQWANTFNGIFYIRNMYPCRVTK